MIRLLKTLFLGLSQPTRRKGWQWGLVGSESLEVRVLLAADVGLDNGLLTIEADDGVENVAFVELEGSELNVDVWQYEIDNQVEYGNQVSHRSRTYDISEVNRILFVGATDHNNLTVHQAALNEGVSIDHLMIEFHGGDTYDFFYNSSSIPSTAYGYGYRDYLDGGFGKDLIYGGEGDDWITGSDGDDYLDGGAGMDYLNGGHGNDTLFGRDDTDFLDGAAGHDRLYGGLGNDILFGNLNFLVSGDGAYSGSEAQYNFALAVEQVVLADHPPTDALAMDMALQSLLGDDVYDELEAGESTYDHDGNDRLYGQNGDDILYGGAGADWLSGGNGSDLLLGGSGNDYQYGGNGNDVIHGGSGSDYLDGGSDSDFLFGGSGHDRLYGRGGIDFLNGGSDNDYLDGGYDGVQDILNGGSGSDRIVTAYAIVSKPTIYSLPTTTVITEEVVTDLDLSEDTAVTLEFFDAKAIPK